MSETGHGRVRLRIYPWLLLVPLKLFPERETGGFDIRLQRTPGTCSVCTASTVRSKRATTSVNFGGFDRCSSSSRSVTLADQASLIIIIIVAWRIDTIPTVVQSIDIYSRLSTRDLGLYLYQSVVSVTTISSHLAVTPGKEKSGSSRKDKDASVFAWQSAAFRFCKMKEGRLPNRKNRNSLLDAALSHSLPCQESLSIASQKAETGNRKQHLKLSVESLSRELALK